MLTSVIFASGKGERMREITSSFWVPKHLLPLPQGETPATRLAKQLTEFSQRIICIVEKGQKELFDAKFLEVEMWNVEVYEREAGWENFINDLQALQKIIWGSTWNILITTGDLVFEGESIKRQLQKMWAREGKIDIVSDWERLKVDGFKPPMRLVSIPSALISSLVHQKISPENIFSLIQFALRNISMLPFVRIGFVHTLANLNTPEDYTHILEVLEK